MTININKAMDYSWMSQAVYLDLSTVATGNKDDLIKWLKESSLNDDKVFANKQATTFTDPTTGYSLINHKPNDWLSGFSATVFKSNDSSNGTYTIAVRGTEPGTVGDLVTDILGVALLGKAREQTIDAYRYYKQLTTIPGQPVVYSTQEKLLLAGLYTGTFSPLATTAGYLAISARVAGDQGLGSGVVPLIPPGATVNFTGHSLGGHVATLLAQMVAKNYGAGSVGDVVTYNAPGQNSIWGNISSWFGADQTIANNVTNVIGEGGMNVTAWIGDRPGEVKDVFIEKEGNVSDENHSIVKLSDSLALYGLYNTLFPTLDFSAINDLLKATSAIGITSLETALDALRTLIFGKDTVTANPTPKTGSDSVNHREADAYYKNLTDLQTSEAFKALAGKVTIDLLVGKSASDMADLAKTDIAYRYALKEGNPFAMLGVDYTSFNTEGKLDLYDATTGKGELTEQYLSDRAKYLAWRIQANTADKFNLNGTNFGYFGSKDWEFTDRSLDASSRTISVSGLHDPMETQTPSKMIFGSDQEDSDIIGGSEADYLYGMGGNDTVDGGAGDDYIEGNWGVDSLKGGDGYDTLFGGTGNDTLDGGKDNDLLKGGEGSDTYEFSGTYGVDTVVDSDGKGTIKIGGQALAGVTYVAENIYKDAATGQIVARVNGGSELVLLKENDANRILIKDWSETKNLGITLQGSAPATPTITLAGDFKKATDGNSFVIDGSNNYVSAGEEIGALDLLNGSGGNDVIDGKAGDDALSGKGGDDYLIGGSGSDHIQAGMGKDTILGGTGDDAIYGSSDETVVLPKKTDFIPPINAYPHPQGTGFNWTSGYTDSTTNGVPLGFSNAPRNRLADDQGNLIDGGAGNDFIAAGTGTDTVHGGADKDLIYGMDKDDILFGDGGNDLIYGDGNMPGGDSVVWAIPANHGNDLIDGGDGDDYLYGQGANDIIFGGIGNDTIWGDDQESELPLAHHGDDYLFGGDGSDVIDGGGGNDVLNGGKQDDTLDGGAGNDTLEGGKGNDVLSGGAGKDTYIFNKGDGVERIIDTPAGTGDAEASVLILGEGFKKEDIKFGRGSLLVKLGSADTSNPDAPQDAIHFEGFDALNPYDTPVIGEIRFANGDVMTYQDILQQGFDFDGTEGDDTLYGTGVTDRINGLGGNDILIGFDGDDVLYGGTGTDAMAGGDGNDTYVVNAGDCQVGTDSATDYLSDSSGDDTVRFGTDVDTSTFSVYGKPTQDHSPNLVIDSGAGDRLVIENGVIGSVEHFEFADGARLDTSELIGRYARSAVSVAGAGITTRLYGGNANETLTASGETLISGGLGNDRIGLQGENNTLIYRRGDGRDTVTATGHGDVLRLTGGLTAADIKWVAGGLILQVGDGPIDTLRFETTNGIAASSAFDRIEFDDGSSLSFADLLSRGVDINGTSDNDILAGTPLVDRMAGGAGDDVYRISDAVDQVIEAADAGIDTVESSIDYRLTDNVENLKLTGNALNGTGNVLDNRLLGNAGSNVLSGEDGNDDLEGGKGNDTLIGGSGQDTYVFALGGGQDRVVESGNEQSILSLRGFDPGAMSASWQNEDLLLTIEATGDQMHLYNVRNNIAQWSVRTESGNILSLADVIQGQYPGAEDQVSVLFANERLRLRSESGSVGATSVVAYDPVTISHTEQVVTSTWTDRYGYALHPAQTENTVIDNISSIVRHQTNFVEWSIHSDEATINIGTYAPGTSETHSTETLTLTSVGERYNILQGTYRNSTFDYTYTDPYGQASVLTTASTTNAWSQNYRVAENNATNGASSVIGGSEDQTVTVDVTTLSNDVVWASEIKAGDSDNTIYGGSSLVDAGGGNDTVYGGGQAILYGNDGNDAIYGSNEDGDSYVLAPKQTLIGGRGADYLDGRGGGDIYRLLNEDSIDTVADSGNDTSRRHAYFDTSYLASNDYARLETLYFSPDTPYYFSTNHGPNQVIEVDTVVLSPGSAPDNITVTGNQESGYLVITQADGTGARIKLAKADDAIGTGIEMIQFSDGSQRTIGQLAAQMNANHTLNGTNGNDQIVVGDGNDLLSGMAGHDVLQGGEGDDTISGDDGDDLITGGMGNDSLSGGTGNDTFYFELGDGRDVIVGHSGAGETNRISFGEGIFASDIAVEQRGDDLRLSIIGTSDAILLRDGASSNVIEQVMFADGTQLSLSELVNLSLNPAEPPHSHPITQTSVQGTQWNDRITVSSGVRSALVSAGAGNDWIKGASGADLIWGGDGTDTVNGGRGDDWLYGDGGNDVYLFNRGDGQDVLSQQNAGAQDVDVLRFGEGIQASDVTIERLPNGSSDIKLSIRGTDDSIRLEGWWDTVVRKIDHVEFADGAFWTAEEISANAITYGTIANDSWVGDAGDNHYSGLGGNDNIEGLEGNDVLTGGAGQDNVVGGSGNDIYCFGRGDGQDSIDQRTANATDVDTVRFGDGIVSTDLSAIRTGDDLVLNIAGGSDSVTLAGWWNQEITRVSRFEFADGTVWSAETVNGLVPVTPPSPEIQGTTGDDLLSGTAGNDVVMGGDGNDTLAGAAGNDVYCFGRGDGQDRIDQSNANATDVDTVRFGDGIVAADLGAIREGDDLLLNIAEGADSITLQGWWNASTTRIARFEFSDGTVWSAETVAALIPVIPPDPGADPTITGTSGDDSLAGTDTDNVLVGGLGNDTLAGLAGNDIYCFNRGDGQDRIDQSTATSHDIDVIHLGSGISVTDLSAARNGDDLVLHIAGGNDNIILQGWWDSAVTRIAQLEFVDGSTLTADALTDLVPVPYVDPFSGLVPTIQGTPGDDGFVGGSDEGDAIDGNAGDDWLFGFGGDDTMTGGAGVDYLFGGVGDDVLTAGAGDGGFLAGGLGSDTYVLNRGDGGVAIDQTIGDGSSSQNYAGTSGTDIVRFGSGITASDIAVSIDSGTLALTISGTSDAFYICGWDDPSYHQIERFVFADGTAWTAATIAEKTSSPPADPDPDPTPTPEPTTTITGTSGDDFLSGTAGNDIIDGGAGNDYLFGGDGDDTLCAGAGEWGVLAGGLGNDSYVLNLGDGGVAVDQRIGDGSSNEGYAGTSGADTVRFGAGILPSDVLVSRNDNVLGLSVVNSSDGIYVWGWWDPAYRRVQSFEFADGTTWTAEQVDAMAAGQPVGTNFQVVAGNSTLQGTNGNDFFAGCASANYLSGNGGSDILQGGIAADSLSGQSGNDLLIGGAGADTLMGGDDCDFFVGGDGNDLIDVGGGSNVIAFNHGDGLDAVQGDDWSGNTVSLGGGIAYSDLSLRKDGNDLVLDTGNSEGLTFKNWYVSDAQHSVLNLQIMVEAAAGYDASSSDQLLNRKVQNFDFRGVVNAFDSARSATPNLTSWALADALANFHLSGSDTVAMGGDLAYQYGVNNSLTGIGGSVTQQVMGDTNFGNQVQTLRPLAGLQEGSVRLA